MTNNNYFSNTNLKKKTGGGDGWIKHVCLLFKLSNNIIQTTICINDIWRTHSCSMWGGNL